MSRWRCICRDFHHTLYYIGKLSWSVKFIYNNLTLSLLWNRCCFLFKKMIKMVGGLKFMLLLPHKNGARSSVG